ncbi:MAG: V-type ATP synthase subunit F [candidate division WOR-3 bacterium]
MIAILGSQEKIQSFQALGIKTVPCDASNALAIAEKLTQDYKIIFYTQELYPALKDLIMRFQKYPLPCFALLPSLQEQLTQERIRELVKKATGTDLLKK